MDPEFNPVKTDYLAGYSSTKEIMSGYVWFVKNNSTDTIKATAVSGIDDYNGGTLPEGTELNIRTNYKGETFVEVEFAEYGAGVATTAAIKLTVTSADGTQSRDYLITLYTNDALPTLTLGENAVVERTDNAAKVAVTANKAGTLYYLAQEADKAAPDAETIVKEGKVVDVVAGENTLELTGLTKAGYNVYMLLKQEDGKASRIRSVSLKGLWTLGDVNKDDVVDLTDVAVLLDKITENESVSLSTGDINGDGVVDMTRVEEARSILHRGNEINQMMKVVGEEGTSAEDYIIYQKGELLDSVYLQQNSFDPIDAACSPDRQREEFGILYDALMASYDLDDKNEIRGFFNQLRQEFLDWHGTEFESPEFYAQEKKISEFYKSKAVE